MSTNSASMPSRMSLTDPAYARTLLLGVEAPEAFAQFCAAWYERFQPVGVVEQDYLEEMIFCRWRLRRLWSTESGCLNAQLVGARNAIPANSSPFEILVLGSTQFANTPLPQQFRRLENSLTRQARDAERRLTALQTRREQQETARREQEQALRLAEQEQARREAEEKARREATEAADREKRKNEPPAAASTPQPAPASAQNPPSPSPSATPIRPLPPGRAA